jgi:hypothetical protein
MQAQGDIDVVAGNVHEQSDCVRLEDRHLGQVKDHTRLLVLPCERVQMGGQHRHRHQIYLAAEADDCQPGTEPHVTDAEPRVRGAVKAHWRSPHL